MSKFVKVAQVVDTIKLHFYHGEETTVNDLMKYGRFVGDLSDLKTEAQSIHHSNNDMRYVNYKFGMDQFRVMAQTVRGFQVTLQNSDVSISFKSLAQKTKDQYPDGFNFDTVVEGLPVQPVIRAEFRASYLAREGHKKAIQYVVDLVKKYFLDKFRIKVSELHLATDVQGYAFKQLDYQRFRTRKSRNSLHDDENQSSGYYYAGRKFTGFSLGSGDHMIRIYNKTVEIKKNPDKEFIKWFAWELNPDYDPYAEVWRIEVQYRREMLKTIHDSVHGLLDGFENVLASIPTLWNLALEKVCMVDLDDRKCLEHFLGYREVDGVQLPLEHNTVRMRIQRALIHPLWEFLSGWRGSIGNRTETFTAPVTGAFRWVSNSIKAFLSTALKHYGDLSPKLLEDAVNRAESEIIRDKGLTLMDNAVNNTLDHLGSVIAYAGGSGEVGYVERDTFSTLCKNLAMYVREASLPLFPFTLSDEYRDFQASRIRILQKTFERNDEIAFYVANS